MCCYNGGEDEGKKALEPLLGGLPDPWFNWMGMMPYPAVQSMFDGLYPPGTQWYWRGDFVKTLPDEAIDAHLAQAANSPSELSLMHLYPIDGAVHRIASIVERPRGIAETPAGQWSLRGLIRIRKRQVRSPVGPKLIGKRFIPITWRGRTRTS